MTSNFSYFPSLSFLESPFTPITYVLAKWTMHYIFQERAVQKTPTGDSLGLKSPCPILQIPQDISEEGIVAHTTFTFPLNAYIMTNDNFTKLDFNTKKFIFLHEFAHAGHYHLHMLMTMELTSLITALFFFPSRPLTAFFAIQQLASIILNSYTERAADSFAIEQSGKDELQGGKEILQYKLNKRTTDWNNATSLLSKAGYLYHALSYYILHGHPLEESRIRKIDQKLTLLNCKTKDINLKNSKMILA